MRIVIPTIARHDIQFTADQLIRAGVPKKYKCFLVISQDELVKAPYTYKNYKDAFTIVGTYAEGISNVRQFIMEKSTEEDNKIVMMDDDLRFFHRPDLLDVSLYQASGEQIMEMVQWLEKALDNHAHASIPARTQNFQLSKRIEKADSFELKTVRPYRIYAYRKDIFLGEKLDFNAGMKINTMDDFHMTLELLELGYTNIVSCRWAHDQCTSNSRGGCSTYRDLELLKASAENLKAKHPQVVETVKKTTKSSWGGTSINPVTRTDVRIQWQKSLGIRAHDSKL